MKSPSRQKNDLRVWIKRRNVSDTQAMPLHIRTGKWKKKGIHFIRRITIVILTFLFRKYRHKNKPRIESMRSVLIIPNFPIGDIVLTSPLWTALRNRVPSLRIGVAASNTNRSVLNNEHIDKIYDLHSPGYFRLLKEIFRARNDKWDVVLAPVGFYKPARFAIISRIIARSGITATMHSARPKRYARIYSFCFARPHAWDCIPMVDQYLSLIELAFDIQISQKDRLPHFTISPDIESETESKVQRLLDEKKALKYILVNVEAKNEYREWGLENVHLLAERVRDKLKDTLIILIASENYRIYFHNELDAIVGENVILVESESIHHAAALIKLASVIISPDTSIVHIAAALNKKLIAFYPAPDEWLPYGTSARILYPVRWEPISSISVDSVFRQLTSLLN